MRCHTKSCDKLPTIKVYWPSEPMFVMCSDCANRALGVSQAMGFHLVVEPMEVVSSQD